MFRVLPQSFWRAVEKITTVESYGRNGKRSDFDIYYLNKDSNPKLLYDLAVVAQKIDHPQYKTYQQLKKIYYGLLYKVRPVEELLSEGREVLSYIKKNSSDQKDALFNKKLVDFARKLEILLQTFGEPSYIYNNSNIPLISSSQIDSIKKDGTLKALGNDPKLFFEIPIPERNHLFNVRIQLDVPNDTTVQAFYKSPNGQYHESLSQRCQARQGENECFFSLSRDTFDGDLRIDPGVHPGWYRIKEIAIFDSLIEE